MTDDIATLVQQLKDQHPKEVVHLQELPPKPPRIASIPTFLHSHIKQWLEKQHITLYSHQVEALQSLIEGKHIIITTPTASGKSLIYQLAVFNTILLEPQATALYLSPLKALSRDQEQALKELDLILKARAYPATYDGDTPPTVKRQIRTFSKIILSNPHAMHQYLDWHSKWQRFFKHLRFVILDEVHAYRGVFGSGVAHLLRRIRRIARYYGSNPQFILMSATLGNSLEFAEKLVGVSFTEIKESGAPVSRRQFIIWNPRIIDEARGLRSSTFMDASRLLAKLVEHEIQTLLFVDSRKMTELIASWTKEILAKTNLRKITDKIGSYRAGYLPEDRRSLEQKIKAKDLLGITTTSALELGIDVGSLDAVILVGYPGSIIQFWQRIGRAGRKQREAIICLTCHNNPLDQYIARHPEHLFNHDPERAVINVNNPLILRGHLLCAAKELPLQEEDFIEFWKEIKDHHEILKELEQKNLLIQTPHGRWKFCGSFRPASTFTIQGMLPSYRLIAGKKVLEILDEQQAHEQAFPNAIYLHQGDQYQILYVDHMKRIIKAKPVSVDYYTEIIKTTDIYILNETRTTRQGQLTIHFGKTEVFHDYPGYFKKQHDRVVTTERTHLGSRSFETESLWFEPFEPMNHRWWEIFDDQQYMAAGLHAAEHAIIHVFPTFSLCDRNDLGGVSYHSYTSTGNPTIFLYEGHQGGTGLLREAMSQFKELISRSLELLLECPCKSKSGCPACIQDKHCGNENFYLLKDAGIEILSWLETQVKHGNSSF